MSLSPERPHLHRDPADAYRLIDRPPGLFGKLLKVVHTHTIRSDDGHLYRAVGL